MLLEVKDLRTFFFTDRGTIPSVDGVSFSLPEGETLCIVGESGCGKSVTSLSIMRLVEEPGRIMGGEIRFQGKDLLSIAEREMQSIRGGSISMIFQDPMSSLNPSYTVGYQIKEALRLHQDLSKTELHAKAIEALKLVAVPLPEERLKAYPFKLSGGLRQRVMIAMAMACRPRLLIADEPTTALDVTIQAQVLALMNELKEKRKTSILFITHDLGVVAEMADHVAVMYAGKIVEQGKVADVLGNPLHPYTEGLLKSLPAHNRGKRKSSLHSIPGNVPSPDNLPPGCAFRPRCPYAQEICAKEKPPLEETRPGHWSACFNSRPA